MSKNSKSSSGLLQSIFAPLVIVIAFIVAYIIFTKIFGDPDKL